MRIESWDAAVLAELERHRLMPFGWGVSDCFVMPMDCVKAMTGTDPWAEVRGYDSRLAAARALTERGYVSVADAFAATFPEVPPALARRGDIGVVEHAGALCGVVVVGAHVVGKSEAGTLRVPRALLRRAFRVE